MRLPRAKKIWWCRVCGWEEYGGGYAANALSQDENECSSRNERGRCSLRMLPCDKRQVLLKLEETKK